MFSNLVIQVGSNEVLSLQQYDGKIIKGLEAFKFLELIQILDYGKNYFNQFKEGSFFRYDKLSFKLSLGNFKDDIRIDIGDLELDPNLTPLQALQKRLLNFQNSLIESPIEEFIKRSGGQEEYIKIIDETKKTIIDDFEHLLLEEKEYLSSLSSTYNFKNIFSNMLKLNYLNKKNIFVDDKYRCFSIKDNIMFFVSFTGKYYVTYEMNYSEYLKYLKEEEAELPDGINTKIWDIQYNSIKEV